MYYISICNYDTFVCVLNVSTKITNSEYINVKWWLYIPTA